MTEIHSYKRETTDVGTCGECGSTLMAVGPEWRYCCRMSCAMYGRRVHVTEVASDGADMRWANEHREQVNRTFFPEYFPARQTRETC